MQNVKVANGFIKTSGGAIASSNSGIIDSCQNSCIIINGLWV